MKLYWMLRDIPRNQEGGGAGGGAGGDGGQGGGQGGQGGQQQQQQQQGWQAPAGVPEHLRGKTADETLAKMLPAFSGLRDELSQKGAAPKDFNGYQINFSDKAKPILNMKDDDPVLPILKQAMHKHGITDKQTGFVADLMDGLIDKGLIGQREDPNKTWMSMAPDGFKGSDLEKVEAGKKAMNEAETFVKQLKGQQGWSDQMVEEMVMLTGSAAGLGIINLLKASGIARTTQPGGMASGGVTKESIAERQKDPRNQYGNPKFDQAFAQETQNMFKQLHGN